MEVKQIYTIVNDITKELIGETAVLNEDLSNIVEIGNTIQNTAGIDNYVKALTDHIGKVVFVNRPYAGTTPSVLMDSWEYGSILEKVKCNSLPEVVENENWQLVDGHSYDPNVFHQPDVSAKFYNNRTTFECDASFTKEQCKSAFSNVNQMNQFLSMLHTNVDTSMAIKCDSLVSRTVNNMIAATLNSGGLRAINLLASYKELFPNDAGITVSNCLTNLEFLRHASYMIKLYCDRIQKPSKLFNIGGYVRFTPHNQQHIILHSEFARSADVYLQSDTFHNELVALPKCETVSYWQGSGTNYLFSSTSAIDIKIANPAGTGLPVSVNKSGILGIIWDRNALGVSNIKKTVDSQYVAKGSFYNYFYKFFAGYFNDYDENAIVFYVEDTE